MPFCSFWRAYPMISTATLSQPWGRNASRWVGTKREISAKMPNVFFPGKPFGDVEVRRGINRGSDQGGGDRGGEHAGTQARNPNILELPHHWTSQNIGGNNVVSLSPWFGFSRNFSSMLGGVTRNSSGHIIAATSALMVWVLEVSAILGEICLTFLLRWTPLPSARRVEVLWVLSLDSRMPPALPGKIHLSPVLSIYPPLRSGVPPFGNLAKIWRFAFSYKIGFGPIQPIDCSLFQ